MTLGEIGINWDAVLKAIPVVAAVVGTLYKLWDSRPRRRAALKPCEAPGDHGSGERRRPGAVGAALAIALFGALRKARRERLEPLAATGGAE